MSIVSVDNISPIGSGTTVTVNKSVTLESGNTNITGVCTATTFSGAVSGTTGTFSDDITVTGSYKKFISNSTSSGDYVRLYAGGGTGKWDIYGNGADLRFSDNDSAGVIRFDTDVSITDKIIHTGDTNTNIRFPAADTITAETGGSERVRIDSSGRIGIGENNPTRDIVIKKSGSVQVSMVGATNQGVYLNFGDTDDDNIGAVYYDNPNDRMIIRANTNNAVQVKSNGNMAINDGDLEIGTSGHGISFAATSDASGMANELLDDYEEGTWTPILTGYTSGNTQTYAAQHGSYTKVGRVVTAHFDVKLSNKGNISGTYVLLQGLPFNHAGSRAGTGSVHFFQHLTSSVSSMALEGGGGISSSFWLLCVNGTQSTQLSYTPDSFISNSTQISGTLVYRVS